MSKGNQQSIGPDAIAALSGKGARKDSNGMPDLIQQFGINANNDKSIGQAFYYLCTSLTWYVICKLRGDTYTTISSVSDIEDIPTQDALKKILDVVVKPVLNQYSLDNDMPTRETKSGSVYPLMNAGLAKPIFKCLGKDYTSKGKDAKRVVEKPKGKLPADLAIMLSESFQENCDGLELDANDL